MKQLTLTILLITILFTLPLSTQADDLMGEVIGNYRTVERTALGEDVIASSPQTIIIDIIKIALSLIAIIFVILTIYSGFQWMTAGGNSETIGKAKSRIINAVIGLVIVLAAFTITEFVLDKVIMAVE